MTQPYSSFQVAGVELPLSTGSNQTLLFDADKPLFFGLDFWSFLITQYVGARLMQAVIAAGPGVSSQVIEPIGQRYPWPPDLEYQSNQFKFPLLAAYRKESVFKQKTASWYNDRCTFDLLYVLPPLSAGAMEQIAPVLHAVQMLIRYKTVQSFDPAYTPPGGTLGQSPWGLAFAGVEEIGFERDSYVTLMGTGNLKFPMLAMSGFFVERDMYIPGTKFAGADIGVELIAADLTQIPNFVTAASQQAPTISVVSPNAGPIAGGTSITLTGSLFLSAPTVLFGNTPATSVSFVNATTITCVAPAVGGSGVLDVIVVNRDAQVGRAVGAYTYS